jgi:uncharacterized repeat protein (TIGR01451 family)
VNVLVVDNAPTGTTITGWTATGTGATPPNLSGTGNISETIASMPDGSSVTYTITVSVPSSYTGNLVNTAVVTSDTPDPDPSCAGCTDTDTPAPSADLVTVKTDGSATYTAGTNVVYTVTVTNNGPSDAVNVLVVDNAPTGTTITGWTATGTGATPPNASGTGNISETIASMPDGSSVTYTITVSVPSSYTGNLVNTAVVTSDTPDPDPSCAGCTDTDTPAPSADLVTVKTDGSATYTAGTNVVYTVTVTNNGPSDAVNVLVVDNAPTGTTITGWTATGTGATPPNLSGTGNISETIASMPDGSSVTYTITVSVPSSYTGNLVNTAVVTSDTPDPDPSCAGCTDTDTPAPSADLVTVKTDGSATYTAGTNVVYTVTVTNNGPSDAVNVLVVDNAPTGTTITGWTATGTGATPPNLSGTGNISETIASMPDGSSVTYTITVSVPSSYTGNLVNTAVVTSDTPDPDPSCAGCRPIQTPPAVAPSADLVTDLMPASLLNQEYQVNGGGWNPWVSPYIHGVLAASAVLTVEIRGIVDPSIPTGSLIVNQGSVTSSTTDPNLTNNTSTDNTNTTTSADLAITKVGTPKPVVAGEVITYTISVVNNGPSYAQNVQVSDIVPGTLLSPQYSVDGGSSWFTWVNPYIYGQLVNGGSFDFMLRGTVSPAIPAGAIFSNTATVSSLTPDPVSGNNSSTDHTSVNASADLVIAKTGAPKPVSAGEVITYTLMVANNGPSNALSVLITDVLPSGILSPLYSTNGGATWTSWVSPFNYGTLAAGSSFTLLIKGTVDPATPNGTILNNTASVSSPTSDPDPGNNSSIDQTPVTTEADLQITKVGTPKPVVAGELITYTIDVVNLGPSGANHVTLTDLMPTSIIGVEYSLNGGISWSPWTTSYQHGTLAAGGSFTVQIRGEVMSNLPQGSLIVNLASVGSSTNDPVTTNNSSSDNTNVITRADLQITKVGTPKPVVAGEIITYAINVSNNGPSYAQVVQVSDNLPGSLLNPQISTNGGISWSTYVNPYAYGPLADGGSFSILIRGTVNPSTPNGSTITNTATVTSMTPDPVPSNNSATDLTPVSTSADIAVSKAVNNLTPYVGDQVTFTITATNNGPSNATGVNITDQIPNGYSLVNAVASAGTSWAAPLWTIGNLPVGITATLQITATVLPPTPGVVYQNIAMVTASNQADPVPGNNSDDAITYPINVIVAVDDSYGPVNGATGNPNLGNAFDNDLINGVAVNPANITSSILTPALPLTPGASVPVMNPATGIVNVPAGTPAGTYTIGYEICENLNPSNCDQATVTVTVDAAEIVAVDDNFGPVNGATGDASVGNAFTNDLLNGVAVNVADITASILTPATPVTPGAPVPVMDPNTGIVSVPAGTPADTYTIQYQICENLNPTNCDIAVVTVLIVPPVIIANDDNFGPVNGATGISNLGNAFDNDLLNGVPVNTSTITASILTPATPITLGASVPVMDPATGIVSVPAGTPAGTYTIGYEICENLNPSNCDQATVTVTVDAAEIVAVDDNFGPVNGATGISNLGNAFDNDLLNGVPVNTSTITASILTPATPITLGASVPVMNPATGIVSVPAGTPAGTYTIGYEICENLNPLNCDQATVTVTVDAAPIVAVDDNFGPVNGATGISNLGNAFDNDLLNGIPVNTSTITASILTPATPITLGASVPVMNPATGIVSVPAGTPADTYTIQYQICENLNPTNCDIAVVTVLIVPPVIIANDDNFGPVNGATGISNLGNAFDNDLLNGVPVNTSTITASILTPATPITLGASVPVMNPATGIVSVPAGTPAGIYTITYEICEILNPSNCDQATVTVTVDAAPIVAVDDNFGPVNGATGISNLGNAFGNDLLNGVPVNTSTITASILTPATPLTLGALVPVMNPATGIVSVPAGTPAGIYTIVYEICENLNPSNCDQATVTVTVDAAEIVAVDDNFGPVNGATGISNLGNAFDNDLLNGVPVNTSTITASILTPATPLTLGALVPVMNPATGIVSVPAGTPAGTYTIIYEICENLNPTNCDIAVVTVLIVPPVIIANDDNFGPVNGATGNPNLGNAFDNDLLNGVPVNTSTITASILTPATPLTLGALVPVMNPATGIVSVPAGTPAGTYTIGYEICENLNPTNCDIAVVTVLIVPPVIIANDDNFGPVNGATGNPNLGNAFDNDLLNGVPVNTSTITASILTPATPITMGASVPVMNPATGIVSVPAGTPAGTYTIGYEICENLNPSNCDQATVTVTVDAAPIVAVDDNFGPVNGATGISNLGNAFGNDLLNGVPVNTSMITASILTPATPLTLGASVPVMDPATGIVSVPAGTPAGTYTIGYEICENLNPTNCDIAVVTVLIVPPVILANDDNYGPVNGATGNPNLGNAFDNDLLNGVPVNTSTITASILTPATPITLGALVPVMDPNTGIVSVPAGTPAGTYTIGYEICENLNPSNCDQATVTVTVDAALILAQDLTFGPVNGATGDPNVGNAFNNDLLNGVPVNTSAITASIMTPATPLTLGALVPVMDPATGIVSVPAGTPAGTYTIGYEICENLNPTNCDQATVSVSVDAAVIVANDINFGVVNGYIGNANVGNILSNDLLNGFAALSTTVNINLLAAASHPGVALDPLTGIVSVAAGTPGSAYTFTYQICEILNPANCDDAMITLNVMEFADLEVEKTVSDPAPLVGDQVTFTITVKNNGANNATGVVVTDQLPTGYSYVSHLLSQGTFNPLNGQWNVGSLTLGSTSTLTLTVTVLEPGAGVQYINNAVVTASDQSDPVPGNNQDDATTTPVSLPSWTLTKTSTTLPNTYSVVGNVLTYQIVVENTGNVSVSSIVVSDPQATTGPTYQSGDANSNNILDVGEVWTYTASIMVTQALLDAGQVVNTATATGTPAGGTLPPATDSETIYATQLPGLVVTKNQVPANQTYSAVGDVLIYEVSVTNTGNVTLTNVLFTDPLTSLTQTLMALPVGATLTVVTNYAVTQADIDAGAVLNTAYGSALHNGTPVYDSDSETIQATQNPSIALIKTGTFIDQAPLGTTNPGDEITYGFTVTNTGNVTLTNVTVTDPLVAVMGGPIASLAPGQSNSTTFTAVYTITQTDIDNGGVTNQALATGTPPLGPPVDDLSDDNSNLEDDPTLTPLSQTPSLSITKTSTTAPNTYSALGDLLTYQIVVANTGNVTLTNVVVEDPLTGLLQTIPQLLVGQSQSITTQYTIQVADLLSTGVVNTATVTTTFNGIPVSDQDNAVVPRTYVLEAIDDAGTVVNGYTGGVSMTNVLTNDELNGLPLNPADVTIGFISSTHAGITLSGTDVSVAAGTPAGTYYLSYEICLISDPSNCDQALVTIPVSAPQIVAVDDMFGPTNGTTGDPNVGNAFDNDLLNGQPVNPADITASILTPALPLTPGAPVPAMDPNTGIVSIPAGTPAGSYTIQYQICENLNPTNCDIAVVTVLIVPPVIIASDDNFGPVNGATGISNLGNAFDNDLLNGQPVNPADITASILTPATPATPGALVPVMDPATGIVSVPTGTPAGSYTIQYQICENLNPTNCDIAVVTVLIVPPVIIANDDNFGPINGATGISNLGNAFDNDLLNGAAVNTSTITASILTPATPLTPGASVPVLDPVTGIVSVPAGTPAGSYTIQYQICENLNPTNCDIAVVTVLIVPPVIIANDDNFGPINGATGISNLGNAFDNDLLNGQPVNPADITGTILTPATPATPGALVPVMDPNTGIVSVPAGTPAGSYMIHYQICENINPTNCDIAVVTVLIVPPVIVANDDLFGPVNGTAGDPNAGNAFDNDLLNGQPVNPADITASILTPATPATPGALVPVMDPATGIVSVPTGTPAGSYMIHYQICENLNPTNCDIAVVTVLIVPPVIIANDDTFGPINGTAGNPNAGNALIMICSTARR